MIKKIIRACLWVVFCIIGYSGLGALLHFVIFPERAPDASFIPRIGAKFENRMQGTYLEVVKREEGFLSIDATFEPNAPGPIPHIHTSFEERFEVLQGTMSILLGDKTSSHRSGQTILIPKGSVHKPFNATHSIVVVRGRVPEEFGIYLSQVYGFFGEPENRLGLRPFFQLSLLAPRYGTWSVDMPVLAQKTMYFVLAPTARLLGYKTVYEKYIPGK